MTSMQIDVDAIVARFKKTYLNPQAGVLKVSRDGNSIKVVVRSAEVANKLPAMFEILRVNCVQDLGAIGERSLIRDASGKVIGAQG